MLRNRKPRPIPSNYDCFGVVFSISHTLYCKKGGLFINLHNELCDRVYDLVGKSFNHSHVRDDPLIYPGHIVREVKAHPSRSPGNNNPLAFRNLTDQKGGLLILDLWE